MMAGPPGRPPPDRHPRPYGISLTVNSAGAYRPGIPTRSDGRSVLVAQDPRAGQDHEQVDRQEDAERADERAGESRDEEAGEGGRDDDRVGRDEPDRHRVEELLFVEPPALDDRSLVEEGHDGQPGPEDEGARDEEEGRQIRQQRQLQRRAGNRGSRPATAATSGRRTRRIAPSTARGPSLATMRMRPAARNARAILLPVTRVTTPTATATATRSGSRPTVSGNSR